ncbi:DNA-binding transcriptional LysR family regulator [Variovorax paradoxus]|uniref:DNA-binding transcriptional LysR family regulator n=1 Tax=Variovorax paradoxus TaxID=34073 RepID=A0AAW8E930_VARPD|nr:LysR family transcriptional regulator [Variovorax paradoxus]MDP9968994.1 DNA-binding transcriptional LysR family regulator [Variovorax paradoxus]
MAALRFTLRQLEIFAAIVRTGSTSGAAAEVSISQSAASAALSDLELMLGLQFFDRVSKKLVLNESGRALNVRAMSLLDAARAISLEFDGPHPSSHFRIAASTTVGNYLIPDLLANYLLVHPFARVDIQIGNTSEVLRVLTDFKADVGVIEGPSNVPGLVLTHWRDDELIVVGAPHHPLVAQQLPPHGPLNLKTLRNATWLVREEGSGTRDAVQTALLPHLGPLKCQLVLGSSEAIRRAVALGLGISCLSRVLVADQLRTGALVELSTELPAISRAFHIVVHQERAMSNTFQSFFAQQQADLHHLST